MVAVRPSRASPATLLALSQGFGKPTLALNRVLEAGLEKLRVSGSVDLRCLFECSGRRLGICRVSLQESLHPMPKPEARLCGGCEAGIFSQAGEFILGLKQAPGLRMAGGLWISVEVLGKGAPERCEALEGIFEVSVLGGAG